jgi:pimeloyl-ACP methyl ester carboxylesterase
MTIGTTLTSGVIDIGTTQLHYTVRGRGPTLMLISSETTRPDEWQNVIPTLAERFMVLTYDRRAASRNTTADEAATLLRRLDLAPAVIVANSSGAAFAREISERHADVVARLALLSPELFGGDGSAI